MNADPDSKGPGLIVNRPYNKKELCYLFGDITLYYLNRMLEDVRDLGFPLGVVLARVKS